MKGEYSEYSDKKLVELMRSEKPVSDRAFSEIYRRYSSMLHTYCNYMLNGHEQAEDIFQETFIRFYKHVNKDHPEINIGGFLYRIARNLSYNYTRDKKMTVPIIGNELIHEPDKMHERNELMGLLRTALEVLDEKYREAFVLREIEGLQYNEIADILDISLSGAKSRVSRAKEKIIDILDPYLKEMI